MFEFWPRAERFHGLVESRNGFLLTEADLSVHQSSTIGGSVITRLRFFREVCGFTYALPFIDETEPEEDVTLNPVDVSLLWGVGCAHYPVNDSIHTATDLLHFHIGVVIYEEVRCNRRGGLTMACTRPAISWSLKLKGSSGRVMPR